MKQHQELVTVTARGRGLHEITDLINVAVSRSEISTGLCLAFVQHTSASLVIQENADPSARYDLEQFFDRLAPEDDPHYTHRAEGPDDMPAHLKSALTKTSEQIPVRQGRLALGTWQGLYLFEHRRAHGKRTIVVHVIGE